MSMQSLANPADVTNRLRIHFNPKLREHTVNNLVLAQFADTNCEIPKNSGSRTARWFKRRPAKTADVVTLVEGVPITTFTEVTLGHVDATLAQIGEATKITDILRAVDLYQPLKQGIEAMGEDCALKSDTIIRDGVTSDMLNQNNGFERFAGVVGTGNSANDFASLKAAQASASMFTRARALAMATQLASKKVPKLQGGYVGIVSPEIMHDIRLDETWLKTVPFNYQALYKREAISLDGIRYVEHTNPYREDAYGVPLEAGAVFSIWFLGKGAFGTPKLSGMPGNMKPQIVICDKPDKSDPLNQFVTAGWKAYWTAKLMLTDEASDVPFMGILRCQTSFN